MVLRGEKQLVIVPSYQAEDDDRRHTACQQKTCSVFWRMLFCSIMVVCLAFTAALLLQSNCPSATWGSCLTHLPVPCQLTLLPSSLPSACNRWKSWLLTFASEWLRELPKVLRMLLPQLQESYQGAKPFILEAYEQARRDQVVTSVLLTIGALSLFCLKHIGSVAIRLTRVALFLVTVAFVVVTPPALTYASCVSATKHEGVAKSLRWGERGEWSAQHVVGSGSHVVRSILECKEMWLPAPATKPVEASKGDVCQLVRPHLPTVGGGPLKLNCTCSPEDFLGRPLPDARVECDVNLSGLVMLTKAWAGVRQAAQGFLDSGALDSSMGVGASEDVSRFKLLSVISLCSAHYGQDSEPLSISTYLASVTMDGRTSQFFPVRDLFVTLPMRKQLALPLATIGVPVPSSLGSIELIVKLTGKGDDIELNVAVTVCSSGVCGSEIPHIGGMLSFLPLEVINMSGADLRYPCLPLPLDTSSSLPSRANAFLYLVGLANVIAWFVLTCLALRVLCARPQKPR